ncbi:MAG: AI-2E family transporter, partial [Chloroflexota bacterium]
TVILGWFVVARLVAQAEVVLANAPRLLEQVQVAVERWNPAAGRGVQQALESRAEVSARMLVDVPLTLVSGLLSAVLVVVMSVYWSLASPDVRRFSFSFVRPHLRDEASVVAQEVVETMGGYVRARGVVALIVGAVVYGGLLVIGVEYPLMLALLAGFGELVPFVGPLVAAAPAVAIALLNSPTEALVVTALYAAVQQVKSHVLMPNLARQQADIPPLLVIFGVLAGGWIGGVVGALVGPPLVGALRVLLLRVGAPALRRWAGTDRRSPSRSSSPSWGE